MERIPNQYGGHRFFVLCGILMVAVSASTPVGDCNTVQQSPYAHVFGVIPVGVLSAMGYLTIAVKWSRQWLRIAPKARHYATMGVFGLALCGTLFSLYLTFLEALVIGDACLWCLTSVVVMTSMLWASMSRAKMTWQES